MVCRTGKGTDREEREPSTSRSGLAPATCKASSLCCQDLKALVNLPYLYPARNEDLQILPLPWGLSDARKSLIAGQIDNT